MNRRPRIEIIAPGASPEEAAAVAAALEQFMRDTAPPTASDLRPALSPWKQAALQEGIGRQPVPFTPWA